MSHPSDLSASLCTLTHSTCPPPPPMCLCVAVGEPLGCFSLRAEKKKKKKKKKKKERMTQQQQQSSAHNDGRRMDRGTPDAHPFSQHHPLLALTSHAAVYRSP